MINNVYKKVMKRSSFSLHFVAWFPWCLYNWKYLILYSLHVVYHQTNILFLI